MSHRDADDREFDALLSGADSELARLYRKLPQAEPDAKLDAAVLAMAHRALNPHLVAAAKQAPRRRRAPTWLVGFGTAAGVVMAAGVAWQMRAGLEQQAATEALRQASTPGSMAEVVAVSPILHDAPVPAAAPPPPALEPPRAPAPPARTNSTASAMSTAALPTPEKPKPVDTLKSEKRDTDRAAPRDVEQRLARVSQPEAFPQVPTEPQSSGEVTPQPAVKEAIAVTGQRMEAQHQRERGMDDLNSVERKAALAAGVRRDEGRVLDKDKKQELEDDRITDSAVASVDAAAPTGFAKSAMSPPAVQAAAPVPATAPAAAGASTAANGIAAPKTTTMTGATRSGSATDPPWAAALERNARLPAKDWLIEIQRLAKAGQRDEAIDNLDRFRERHPHFAIPADLRDLHR